MSPAAPQLKPELLAKIAAALNADGSRILILSKPLAQRAQIFSHGLQPRTSTPIERNSLWQNILYPPATTDRSFSLDPAPPEPLVQVYPVDNVSQQPELALLLTAFQSVGIESLLILPLRYDRQCVGCLTLFRSVTLKQDSRWTKDELQLAQSLAMQMYLAVMQQRIEQMIRDRAYYDLLTGLPNRIFLNQWLTLALAKMPSAGEVLAVIFLNLDKFKNINDRLGHWVGDRLLQLIAERLVRMGIGIANRGGLDSQAPIQQANAALKRAQNNGKNSYEIYTVAPLSAVGTPAVEHRLQLENMLDRVCAGLACRAAGIAVGKFNDQKLLLYYQPQIDTQTGKMIGVEALLRCQDIHAKIINPANFITLAEETDAIIQIGEWVIRAACQQKKLWQELGLGDFPIAVNFSVKQLQDRNLIDTIVTILAETGLSPAMLEVEITESMAIEDLDLTIAILASLREIGVKISLDDFGTGYSSLAALKYLPLDRLKIDRSFIRELRANTVDAGIVRTIVNLGHELNLNVIAEGVETVEQFEFLRSINCDAVQGFLFSRPLAASDFESMMITQTNDRHQNIFYPHS
ncbi:MAG: EAL domain-containing protein [Chamaesiphon sp.]|nr:EAL domain-containing protein [Chamaesiphon sp.]